MQQTKSLSQGTRLLHDAFVFAPVAAGVDKSARIYATVIYSECMLTSWRKATN
jgi:hypothetical protein